MYWTPQPESARCRAPESALVDARLPGFVAFLDADIACEIELTLDQSWGTSAIRIEQAWDCTASLLFTSEP